MPKITSDMQDLLSVIAERFADNKKRHPDVDWAQVEKKLMTKPDKLKSLQAMEQSGGEPDVVQLPDEKGIIFVDCSPETPDGHRNTCYDQEALEKRKKNKPKTSVEAMTSEMGIDLLTAEQYCSLQEFGEFDLKTSSWVKTPAKIRELGGALFCDRRYDTVFVYHNGAESYYSSRGFRGLLRL